ncbi:MAG: PKD domain-containing protein, partial [Candidatus Thermoplasmatota archaeon]|nr:PKD domain-containing protein [Candidatus Thermoplasmatota archaeon]
MRKSWVRKGLVLGIILLFLGASIPETLSDKNPEVNNAETSNRLIKSNPSANFHILDPGDILFVYDVETPTGDNLCRGVYFDGTYFYITGGMGYPNHLYFFSSSGSYLSSVIQPTPETFGWRDIATDGTYMYSGCDSSSNIAKWYVTGLPSNPVLHVVSNFTSPLTSSTGLTYDPSSDHFWTALWDSDIYEIDRNGIIINTYPNDLAIYGMAWDSYTSGGPWIWVYSQDGSSGCLISQFNPSTGQYTGVTYEGVYQGSNHIAGGLCFTTQYQSGIGVLIGCTQDDLDLIFGMEIGGGGGNQNPIADFTWLPQVPNPGQTINFDASASYDPDGSIVSYKWDFDNDGLYDDRIGQYTTWSWLNPGIYPVSLMVWDDQEATGVKTKTVTVGGGGNQPPVANAGGPYSGNVGVSITFNGLYSYDPDGSIIGYRWDYTNDGSWDTGWLTTHTRQYTFYSQFHGKVKLEVKDNQGATNTATAKLDIGKPNQAPVASFSWSPSSPKQGDTVTFDASSSYDPDGSIIKYEWDWNNDGSYDISRTTPTVTHTWSSTGTYSINLRVTDNSGATKIKKRDITISNAGPPPFDPPKWVKLLMIYTSVHEQWKGDHYYVNIPMKSPFLIPILDCSIPIYVNLPAPFNGQYIGKTDAFSSYIEVKIYPNSPQKNTFKAKSYVASNYIQIPLTKKLSFRTVFGFNLNDASWDSHDVYIKGEIKYDLKGIVKINTWVVIVPVTINIDLVALGGLEAGINNPETWVYSGGVYTNVWDPDFYVGLEVIGKGGLGFNFGWIFRASLGIYGKIGGYLYVPPPRIKISGEIGVYGELGPFEGRWA